MQRFLFYSWEKCRDILFAIQFFCFANFEFIFAIRDPKLARGGIEKYNEHCTKQGTFAKRS